ncbi:MAG TPA: L,D-transpeptidase, partial [Minicystis sp.]|nr:L,D-transpeptidase [Minicystis sp.]
VVSYARGMRPDLMSRRASWALAALLAAAAASASCKGGSEPEGIVALSSPAPAATNLAADPATIPRPGGPRLGAVAMAATIHIKPDRRSQKLGYLRAGATVVRGEKPVAFDDCKAGYYRVLPVGYVCAENEATLDMKHPILRALTRRPDLSKPMPYPYAFVRAIAPNYYRVPTKKEQFQYEMSLKEHLRSYKRLHKKWDSVTVGSNDVPLDAQGNAIGEAPAEPPDRSDNEIFGGHGDDAIPWFFRGGRQIPNISSFRAPDYAIITNRVARHAGIALIDSFVGDGDRRFSLTTDARLVPASKLKPALGSTFHGVDMSQGKWQLPVAFVKRKDAHQYDLSGGGAEKSGDLAFHVAVQLTGRSKRVGDARYVEAKDGSWLRDDDLAIAVKPSELPAWASRTKKWIDVSLLSQTLLLYEGTKPIYATAVSTGRDGLGDPKKTHSTVRGIFHIREKHVTTTMDAHEVDNKFELRDVPWVEYFEAGYAIHAAPWHDEYGKPRSHGCVNLAPIDARRVFMFTDPPLPTDWHAVYSSEATGEGTTVYIHP